MTPSPVAPIIAGLLIGGRSRRFGSPKALAAWRGRPLACWVAEALAELAPEVLAIGAGELPAELSHLARIDDAGEGGGPLSGLLGALRSRPDRAWLVAACDQPLLDASTLGWLVGQRREGAIAVVARLAPGGIEPFPALYEPAARPILEELARGAASLQPLAEDQRVVVAAPPASLRRAWTSVDTEIVLRGLEEITES